MQGVPLFAGEEAFEIFLGLHDVFSGTQTPALREAMNVGIDRKGGHPKGLTHDHRSGLVPHRGKSLQRRHVCRHLAAVLIDEDARESRNALGFHGSESAGPNDGVDVLNGKFNHVVRVIRLCKEQWGDLVDAGIGALGGEEDCDKEGVGVAVIQRDGGLRIKPFEGLLDMGDAFCFEHRGTEL